jgi:hypothetical protein
MITKETADALAQLLLEQEQRQSTERKNARARRSHLLYRFPELKRFEPWQRELITRRCAELVLREPLIFAGFFVWLAGAVAVAFNVPSRVFGVSSGLFIVILGLALLLFHRWRVRHNVRAFLRFIRDRQASTVDAR